MLSCYAGCTLLCMLIMQPSRPQLQNFRLNATFPTLSKVKVPSSNCKIQPRCSNSITHCKPRPSISGFRCEVDGNWALLGSYAARSGNSQEERSLILSNGLHLITLPASLPNGTLCLKPTFTGGRVIAAW